MKSTEFTPEKSLELITQVIAEARDRFEENGFVYMLWGALIAVASLGQFVLIETGHGNISWYPYLLMPAGAIYTSFYYARRKKPSRANVISLMMTALWVVLSIYMMVLGFLFGGSLKEHLIPVILILLSIGITVSGTSLRSGLLVAAGIFIGLSALAGFYMDRTLQSLWMGVVSFVAIFIPGLIMMYKHKRRQ